MKWEQLDLLASMSPQPQKSIEPPKRPFTITQKPTGVYKVVLAPGLTTAPIRNPCFECPNSGTDKNLCLPGCSQRLSYLEHIGPPIISAVSAEEGTYGLLTQ